jgi:hypothetical protein
MVYAVWLVVVGNGDREEVMDMDWNIVYDAVDHIHEVYGDNITDVSVNAWNTGSCVSVMIGFTDRWMRLTRWCYIYRNGNVEWS